MGIEKRKQIRFPLEGLGELSWRVVSYPSSKASTQIETGLKIRAQDISSKGLGFTQGGFIPPESILEIDLPDPMSDSKTVGVQGAVTWCIFLKGREFRAGIQFKHLSRQAEKVIGSLIQKARSFQE